jgi:hypothetical protein
MEIVLDAVSTLRSLRPPTDIHERCVSFHNICSLSFTQHDSYDQMHEDCHFILVLTHSRNLLVFSSGRKFCWFLADTLFSIFTATGAHLLYSVET